MKKTYYLEGVEVSQDEFERKLKSLQGKSSYNCEEISDGAKATSWESKDESGNWHRVRFVDSLNENSAWIDSKK